MQESGIYSISCLDCDAVYVGQTKRMLAKRDDEHRRACKNKQVKLSAVAEHVVTEGHRRGECELIQKVDRTARLDAWESLHMDKAGDRLMNTQEAPLRSSLYKFALTSAF